MRNKALIYIHGKGGSAAEAEHYESFFPEHDVIGFDYKADKPWDAVQEFQSFFVEKEKEYERITIVANSIGAFYALNALNAMKLEKAWFISPIVNMERLIHDMMTWAKVSEAELERKGVIDTDFGERLSWQYLCWVRENPVSWDIPTEILYGSNDNLQSYETIREFADKTGSRVTIMKNGEHWFHTEEQMAFLDEWLKME